IAPERVLSITTTSVSSASLSSQRYNERAAGKIVPHATSRRSSSARTNFAASSALASVVRTTTASVWGTADPGQVVKNLITKSLTMSLEGSILRAADHH